MNLPHHARLRRRVESSTSRHRNPIMGGVQTIDCRARFDPISGGEDQGDRQTDRITYNVLLEARGRNDAQTVNDLTGGDEVEWIDAGLVLQLDGPTVPLSDGLGRTHHFEVVAYRAV